MSQPPLAAHATRAAQKPTRLAMLPPLTIRPPQVGGKWISSAIQRTACASSSVAPGASACAPTLAFNADATKSPRMPIGAGGAVM